VVSHGRHGTVAKPFRDTHLKYLSKIVNTVGTSLQDLRSRPRMGNLHPRKALRLATRLQPQVVNSVTEEHLVPILLQHAPISEECPSGRDVEERPKSFPLKHISLITQHAGQPLKCGHRAILRLSRLPGKHVPQDRRHPSWSKSTTTFFGTINPVPTPVAQADSPLQGDQGAFKSACPLANSLYSCLVSSKDSHPNQLGPEGFPHCSKSQESITSSLDSTQGLVKHGKVDTSSRSCRREGRTL